MGIYQYIGLAAVSSLSISVGAFVAAQSEEELKDGVKYIKTLIAILSYLAMLLTARELISNILLSAFIPTILILITFYISRIFRNYIFLVFLGVCFSVVNKNIPNYLISSLIFITGICIGSMIYYSDRNRLYSSISLKTGFFIFISLVLLFI